MPGDRLRVALASLALAVGRVVTADALIDAVWASSNMAAPYYGDTRGVCLDVDAVSTANSARIIQWTCNGGQNQQFLQNTT